MLSKPAVVKNLVFFVVFALVLAACVRPLAQNGEDATPEESIQATAAAAEEAVGDAPVTEGEPGQPADEADEVEQEVAEVPTESEETAPAETESESPGPDESSQDEAAEPAEGGEVEEEEASAEVPETVEEESETASEEEAAVETEAEEAAAESESDEAVVEEEPREEAASESSQTLPATHTVAPGENLYRIGLKYGMSWVPIAQANGLANANQIYVGQVLVIPGGQPPPDPVPPPSGEYTNYVVKRGDTLSSIGRAFGVSWVEIAEANGIVNPNLIYAGQVLKIPTSAPGQPPQFTHVVQPGETLYRISLRYGVHWLSIAQANNIASPYVIYPGQTLVIPGA